MRDLTAFWATLDLTTPDAAVQALEDFLPGLIQQYGEIGAAVAANFYDTLREREPAARQAYDALLADAVPLEQVRGSLRWAVAPLFDRDVRDDEGELEHYDADPDAAFGRVLKMTDRLVKEPGRRTIADNTLRDPARARYARIPTGTETCRFCVAMASRGAVYLDEDSAGRRVNDKFVGNGVVKYHDHCDCAAVPVWGDELPEGYDPGLYFELYEQGRGVTPEQHTH